MPLRELQPGLWRWEAPHPDWTPTNTERWGPEVSSYAIDPVARPSELEELAADRETVIVLTNPWHERDARGLVERLGASVFVPQPDDFNDDVAWLRLSRPRSRCASRPAAGSDD
jgi:hypothetical protein